VLNVGVTVERAFVTGDAVALDLRVARIGSRLVARVLDLMVQLLLIFIFTLVTGLVLDRITRMDEALTEAVGTIIAALVLIGYPVLMLTVAHGHTLGKMAMGLRVVREDGGRIRFRHALTRELIGVGAEFPGLLPPLTWFAGLTCVLTNADGRRIGDLAAGTVVIYDRAPQLQAYVPYMPPYLSEWASTLDLSGLDDGLALAVRQYLGRFWSISLRHRIRLGALLVADVAARTSPLPPGGISTVDFLCAVLAERHQRSANRLIRARTTSAALWPSQLV
jgi:uncharacterized RDD family membrane protein YckC